MNSNDDFHATHIGPMTDEIVNELIREFKRKKIKDKIVKHVIDPIICDIAEKYYPHIVTLMVLLALMILLMLSILIMSLVPSKKSQM